MKLIGRRKKKSPFEQGFAVLRLALNGLAAQRVARSAYKGYKWTRRLPLLLAGAAIVAFIVRKATQSSGEPPEDAGYTPPAPPPSAPIPSTPTPTGSPSAVSPAPTAAADAPTDDGGPETATEGGGAAAGKDAEPKS